MKSKTVAIRKPSAAEQRAAQIKTSDYQISGLNIQSAVLFSFGLSNRVYRSKNTVVQYNTTKRAKSITQAYVNFFENLDDEMSIEDFYNQLKVTKTSINKELGIDFKELAKSAKSWNIIKDEKLMQRLDALKVPSNLKKLFSSKIKKALAPFVEKYKSPSKFLTRITLNESYDGLARDWFMKPVTNELLDFDSEKKVKHLKKFIFKYIEKATVPTVRAHSQTILNEFVIKRQNEIIKEMGGPLSPKVLFDWLLKNDEGARERIQYNYGIDIAKDTFSSFEELTNYLYEPKMMHQIRNRQNVNVRARQKGELRKGTELSIDKVRLDRENERCRKFIEEHSYSVSQKLKNAIETLNDRKEKYTQIKNVKSKAKKALKIALISGDEKKISQAQKTFDNAASLMVHLKYDYDNAKKAIKKLEKVRDLKKAAIQTLESSASRELKLFKEIENDRNAYDDLYILRRALERKVEEDDYIPYFSWEFVMKGYDRNAVSAIEKTLETTLNNAKTEQYINVSSSYVDGQGATNFYVDYPKTSGLYKAFIKNTNLPDQLLNALSATIKRESKYTVQFKHKKCNVPMEESLK